jgi:hypothetical protein
MASRALAKFIESMGIAQELIDLERQCPSPPRKADQAKVSGLRGGAAVIMVASFEAFLRAVVVEHLSELTVNPPPVAFADLPEKMRVSSVYYCLDAALRGPRHQEKKKFERLPAIKAACARIAADIIDPEALSVTQSNPSPDTVKRIYSDLGIPDVFTRIGRPFLRAWGKREAVTFIPDKLREIVDRRHRVAHTGSALDITRSQLNESLKFLRILATQLEKQLRHHVDS